MRTSLIVSLFRLFEPPHLGCYGLQSFSTFAFTTASILMSGGQGRLSPNSEVERRRRRSAGFPTCCIAGFQPAERPPGPNAANSFTRRLEALRYSRLGSLRYGMALRLISEFGCAPVKLGATRVRVPPVELDCSRPKAASGKKPRGGTRKHDAD